MAYGIHYRRTRDVFMRRISANTPATSNIVDTSSPRSTLAWSSSTKPSHHHTDATTSFTRRHDINGGIDRV
jgi:hypothetical protein